MVAIVHWVHDVSNAKMYVGREDSGAGEEQNQVVLKRAAHYHCLL